MAAETNEYVVAPNQWVERGGVRYDAGDVVKLTDAEAASLAPGVVSAKKDLTKADVDGIKAAGDAARATDLQSRGSAALTSDDLPADAVDESDDAQ